MSEIGESERYWSRRARRPEGVEAWNRLRAIRRRHDLEVIDLNDRELQQYAQLVSPSYARKLGLLAPLGPGEAATIAIAEARGWTVAMDDGPARVILHRRSPTTSVSTTRELLRKIVACGLRDSAGAQLIYDNMLDHGYRGLASLWD